MELDEYADLFNAGGPVENQPTGNTSNTASSLPNIVPSADNGISNEHKSRVAPNNQQLNFDGLIFKREIDLGHFVFDKSNAWGRVIPELQNLLENGSLDDIHQPSNVNGNLFYLCQIDGKWCDVPVEVLHEKYPFKMKGMCFNFVYTRDPKVEKHLNPNLRGSSYNVETYSKILKVNLAALEAVESDTNTLNLPGTSGISPVALRNSLLSASLISEMNFENNPLMKQVESKKSPKRIFYLENLPEFLASARDGSETLSGPLSPASDFSAETNPMLRVEEPTERLGPNPANLHDRSSPRQEADPRLSNPCSGQSDASNSPHEWSEISRSSLFTSARAKMNPSRTSYASSDKPDGLKIAPTTLLGPRESSKERTGSTAKRARSPLSSQKSGIIKKKLALESSEEIGIIEQESKPFSFPVVSSPDPNSMFHPNNLHKLKKRLEK